MFNYLFCRTLLLNALFFTSILVNLCYAQNTGNEEIDRFLHQSQEDYKSSNYDQAELHAQSAFELSRRNGNLLGMGLSLQNEALAIKDKNKKTKANRKKAIQKLQESLEVFSSINQVPLRIKSLEYLRDIAVESDNYQEEKLYIKQINDLKSLLQADLEASVLSEKSNSLTNKVENLNAKVTKLNKEQLQAELLIALQKNSVDSLEFKSEKDSLILSQNKSILAEKESEIALQRSQQLLFFALLVILAILVVFIFLRYKETRKNNEILALKNEIIQEEREKSDGLLLNILPSIIAKELKVDGVAQARKYESATVFFSDFVNFSKIANELSPEILVALLDEYFRLFDEVIEKYGLEKIKTIGDAYMCVGGLPETNSSHPGDVINAALEIQSMLTQKKNEKINLNQPYFEARIGIHTGPLVAGVVGSKKFAFDIWGDTVNVASRLESNSDAGKVNISHATYELVKNDYSFTSRGEIPIKNLGQIKMYFVDKKD
jgi:class 3 adenylate cyclase